MSPAKPFPVPQVFLSVLQNKGLVINLPFVVHQWTHFFLCLLCDPSPHIPFLYFVPFVFSILVPYNFLWLDLWFGIFYHVIKWSIPPLVLSDVDTYIIIFMILNDLSLFHQQLWVPTNSFSFCFYLILVSFILLSWDHCL